MKTPLLLSGLLLTVAPCLAQESYQFLMDQRNLEGGGFVRSTVEQEDSMTSPMPVPEGGSEFVLWAVHNPGPAIEPIWTHIGTEVVGAYLPQGQLQIITQDPYNGGIPRTRIDQPFVLQYSVSGLQTDNEEAPESAKKVLFDHRLATTLLTEGVTEPDETVTPELVSQGLIVENMSGSRSYFGSLPGDDIHSESGIETFTLNALPDGDTASLLLSKAQVKIFPLAEATIVGLEEDATYAAVPDFTVDLSNVYPNSDTYLQYYAGPEVPGTTGTRVGGSSLLHSGTKVRSGQLTFQNFANNLPQDGIYTVEVVTVTPFGSDVIESLTFEFDNTIDVRGGIHSLE